MKCPYCGGEMKQGYVTAGLNNRDNAYWRPKTKGLREWVGRRYSESILLSGGFRGKGAAWYCPPCGKIVIDVVERTEAGQDD